MLAWNPIISELCSMGQISIEQGVCVCKRCSYFHQSNCVTTFTVFYVGFWFSISFEQSSIALKKVGQVQRKDPSAGLQAVGVQFCLQHELIYLGWY